MLERIIAPPQPVPCIHRKPQIPKSQAAQRSPEARGSGAIETAPLCQDLPIIPLYRSGSIVWMNLVVLDLMVKPVFHWHHWTGRHAFCALNFA